MTNKQKRTGRPKKPANEVRETILKIRLSSDEYAALVIAADADDCMEVSTWARNILRRVAGMKPDK